MITIKRILCPVDFHRASLRALKYASALAADHNGKLRLLHVVAPIMTSAYPFPSVVASASAVMKTESERQIEKLMTKVKIKGIAVDSEVIVALRYALSIGRKNDARITLLHVVPLDAPFSFEDGSLPIAKVENALSELLPAKLKGLGSTGIRVSSGTPYQVILNTVEKQTIDLLVMNIHGKGMLERALLGSTAERVVRASPVPVMMIPPAKTARKPAAREQAA